jgi:hypothetical protein
MAGTALRLTLGIASALVTFGLVVFNLSLIANRVHAGVADSRLDHLVIGLYVASIVVVPMTVIYRSAGRSRNRSLLRSVLMAVLVSNLIAAPYLLVTLAS